MRQIITLLIILPLVFTSCQVNSKKKPATYKTSFNDIHSFLKEGDLEKISSQKEDEIISGCIVTHTTKGFLELRKILNDSTYFKSLNDKKLLCISIIENRNLFHLHYLAGKCLSDLLENDDKVGFILNNTNKLSVDYCLILINQIPEYVILGEGSLYDRDSKLITELTSRLNDDRLNTNSKIYILDGIYSVVFKEQAIKKIHSKIGSLNIDKELLLYNDSLYNTCLYLKIQFEQLDNLTTYMEMDNNYDGIKKMFINYQPVMFYQFLCFNPSTILESLELSKLKEIALINIIKNANDNSFYDDVKYAYLHELLFDNDYTIRFLNSVMKRDSIPQYALHIRKNN